VNDINEFGGIYYFDMEIQRHDTGEFIYRETVPFRMPFVQDFTYLQTNILYHDSNVYEQTLISDILDPPLELLKGQIVNIKCKTTTSNEVLLEFLNNNNPIDTYTVISRGNDNFGEQFVQIIIRKDITVDQFKFSVNLENEQYFMAHDIVFMDSLITTPEGEWFTPISVTNDGNVIEFVEFSFSGVSFDNIDTSMYTEEFYKKTQLITLMPGEHRDCMFKITSPTTPIDNLYWRGIRTYDPITDEVYIGYADSLEIEGIHIQTPKNETYNIFGINNNFEVGIPLEIVAEDDLLWSTYSLDNSPEVIFSERIYIPLSKIDGIHSLKVYGETTSNQLISSETRYFTVEHAITILNPTNTTISGPSLGYYIATYGFEGDWDGSISFVDQNYGGAGCTLKIISELDGHNDVLKLEDIGSGGHQAIHIFDEGAQQYGTIEFWWRTSDATDNQNLQPRASNGIDRLFRLRIDNDILEYYDGSWHTIINQWKDNEWHHFRIDFEQTGDYYQGLSENEWQLYVDGVKYGPYGFEVDIIPDRLYLHTDSSGTHDVYYDAFGFSWDNQYSIGDNLKEGILFDTISKIKIDDLRYKLDNGDYIYSPTSFVLPKLENGAYSLIFYGFDDYGNEWSSEKRWFTIEEDFDPPQMTGIQVIYDPLELGESQTIITSIIDGSGIRTITAYIQFPDGTTIAELPMKNIGGDKYKATWNYESAHLGVYYIDINTIDASFNSNNLYIDNAIVYDLEDTINPVISNILVSNNPLDRFDIQTITCNIEDLSSLQTVTAYIQYPDGTNIASLQMTNVVGDTYEAQWDSSSAAYGNYYVDIEAIDASPNQNLGYFDNGAMFSVIEPPAPTIDIISPSNGATISGYKTIRAVASSKAGITKVQFKIDGVLKREDTNGADGWSYYWNTNTVSNGGHTITCKAFDSLGRTEIDSISVTVQNSAGGGGGCPYLSVYNGDQYIPEGLLDIHNVDGIDVKFYHTLNTEPLAVNNRYHLRLTEHYKTISHIDNVRLYGRLSNGLYLLLPLLSATHSVLGQVTLALWFSDDVKVGVLGADHTNGMSEFIDLEFIAFWPFTFSEFVFVIEGNNYIIK
ncbi:MAG: Ig-like domain-containing protein, partial [Candidatus Hermodarchaeota archaeon]